MIPYSEPPLHQVSASWLEQASVSLSVLREDLNHPLISGNKWWKMKYNLIRAKEERLGTLLTFGGAYSNHIYATAAAASIAGFKSIGIIRGEEARTLNPTLSFAVSQGMELHYVDRTNYRRRNEEDWVEVLASKFGKCYIMPEGGTNLLAIQGCTEWAQQWKGKYHFDFLCLPVGTGGTMAGIIKGIEPGITVLGFSVLKDGHFLKDQVRRWLPSGQEEKIWEIITEYDQGGYAKTNKEVDKFMKQFELENDLPLEHVYSGKMMWGIYDLIVKGYFPRGSHIVALHTGGLQNRNNAMS